jgi:phospholipid/cholesterol/gamma-HCH transport system substrate-binding protein
VTINVDGRYRFPKDTFALILTAGLLGEQYIGLDPAVTRRCSRRAT